MLTYKAASVCNSIPVVIYDNGGNNSSPGLGVAEGPRVVKEDKVGRPEQGLSWYVHRHLSAGLRGAEGSGVDGTMVDAHCTINPWGLSPA